MITEQTTLTLFKIKICTNDGENMKGISNFPSLSLHVRYFDG